MEDYSQQYEDEGRAEMFEPPAYKIICKWCKREIYIPGPLSQVSSKDTFYCSWCGQYTKIGREK